MDWIKYWVDRDDHPKMLAAGLFANTVFGFLCRMSGKYDLNGKLAPEHSSPEYIAARLRLAEAFEHLAPDVSISKRREFAIKAAERALKGLKDNGWISLDGLSIPSWSSDQADC